MDDEPLENYGWSAFFQQQLSIDPIAGSRPVRVTDVQKSGVTVIAPDFAAHLAVPLAGITVGDWLLVDDQQIKRRLERSSLFKRIAPGTDRREQLIAANIDILFIVSSCNQDFNEARLERYIAIAREAAVLPLVVLTKADLCADPADFASRAAKLAPGLLVETVNALNADSLKPLDVWLGNGQTIALLGSSGVGKSTLTNTLLGRDKAATQGIRGDDDKGRHTTTARTLYRLPGGAWLLDTPGMRELQLADVRSGLNDVFAEISELARDCRFADCQHNSEPGCAVRRAVTKGLVDEGRISRWRKLRREDAHNSASVAERRARDRSLGRYYKSVIAEKKGERT